MSAGWVAVVPFRAGAEGKSRLTGALSGDARARLSDHMVAHVLACLTRVQAVSRTIMLSPARHAGATCEWWQDKGRGLNAELSALREALGRVRMVVVHGDLPLLQSVDVDVLLDAAHQVGIAPDRHGTGTNALALANPAPFAFAFGEDSFNRHLQIAPRAAIVRRSGLELDIDTADDLAIAIRAGFRPPL